MPFALKLYESLLDSVPQSRAVARRHLQRLHAVRLRVRRDGRDRARRRAPRARLGASRARAQALPPRHGRTACEPWRSAGAASASSCWPIRRPALARAERKDVEMLYWTAASWGAAISLGLDQPELAVDFPVVRALADRALALDETWSKGALHELMISLDSLPEALGGDAQASAAAFRPRGRTAERPVARAVRRARDGRVRARRESRGVREIAQAGARRRSQRGCLRRASPRSSRSGVHARCSIKSTPASCNSFVKEFRMSARSS